MPGNNNERNLQSSLTEQRQRFQPAEPGHYVIAYNKVKLFLLQSRSHFLGARHAARNRCVSSPPEFEQEQLGIIFRVFN
jgi:hypothetical protein